MDGTNGRGRQLWLVQTDASSALASPSQPLQGRDGTALGGLWSLVSVNQSIFTLFPILQRRLHGVWVLHLRASACIYTRTSAMRFAVPEASSRSPMEMQACFGCIECVKSFVRVN